MAIANTELVASYAYMYSYTMHLCSYNLAYHFLTKSANPIMANVAIIITTTTIGTTMAAA